jgi:hypothetical protein
MIIDYQARSCHAATLVLLHPNPAAFTIDDIESGEIYPKAHRFRPIFTHFGRNLPKNTSISPIISDQCISQKKHKWENQKDVHTAEFKGKEAIEALREQSTLSELSSNLVFARWASRALGIPDINMRHWFKIPSKTMAIQKIIVYLSNPRKDSGSHFLLSALRV